MSTPCPKIIVVVDPYSSGRYLVHELQQLRWPMVAVQSSQDLASFWLEQHDPALYLKTIPHESLEKTIAALREFDVVGVLAGSEPGVLLSEDLQEYFKVAGNPAATKHWRRDKHAQQERLREAGVRAVAQTYSADVDELLTWQRQWGTWPIIVKPTMSGGTDGVYWCYDEADVRLAHEKECGKMNVNGCVNEKLLAQEYLDGSEYIVDTVSFKGKHVVSGIWLYKKVKDPIMRSEIKVYARILESQGKEQDILTAYTFQALDALGFEHGPAHSEVIITESGPCLVETGARMHGLKGPKMTEYATGIGTHELVVDITVGGGRLFNSLYQKGTKYSLKKFAFETLFTNKKVEGILAESIDTKEIRELPSVLDIFPSVKPGEELKITRDLATSPGVILQVHSVEAVCFADITRIRDLEDSDLYKVQAVSAPSFSVKPMVSPMTMSPVRGPSKRKDSVISRTSDLVLDGKGDAEDDLP